MDLSFLLWNFNPSKADATRMLAGDAEYAAVAANIVREREVDLLILLECSIPDAAILGALQTATGADFHALEPPHPRIRYFSRFPQSFFVPFRDSGRVSIRRIVIDGCEEILLATTHSVDARNNDEDQQWLAAEGIRDEILDAEADLRHSRTLLVGDFNMNPYHKAMLDPSRGFGAMMTWEIAEAHAKEDNRPRFFNPMWNKMGTGPAPGTFYFRDNEPKNPFWNCIDGVLLRPSLRSWFSADRLAIVDSYSPPSGERVSLIRLARKHYSIAYSDHLPVSFRLTLPPRLEVPDARGH